MANLDQTMGVLAIMDEEAVGRFLDKDQCESCCDTRRLPDICPATQGVFSCVRRNNQTREVGK